MSGSKRQYNREYNPENILDALSIRYSRAIPRDCYWIDQDDIRQEMAIEWWQNRTIKSAQWRIFNLLRHLRRISYLSYPKWLPYHYPTRDQVVSASRLIHKYPFLYDLMMSDCSIYEFSRDSGLGISAISMRLTRIRKQEKHRKEKS